MNKRKRWMCVVQHLCNLMTPSYHHSMLLFSSPSTQTSKNTALHPHGYRVKQVTSHTALLSHGSPLTRLSSHTALPPHGSLLTRLASHTGPPSPGSPITLHPPAKYFMPFGPPYRLLSSLTCSLCFSTYSPAHPVSCISITHF